MRRRSEVMVSEGGRRRAGAGALEVLRESIRTGALGPGERLAPEPELAQALGISRASVREAKKVLSAQGFIVVRHGVGSFVAENFNEPFDGRTLRAMLTHRTLQQVWEVRRIVEGEAAALAAERAGPSDLGRMRTSLQAIREAAGSKGSFLEILLDFHSAVIEAAHNEVLTSMFATVRGLLREHQLPAYRPQALTDVVQEYADHEKLFEAVSSGDSRRARREIHHHLRIGEQRVMSWKAAAVRQSLSGEDGEYLIPDNERTSLLRRSISAGG